MAVEHPWQPLNKRPILFNLQVPADAGTTQGNALMSCHELDEKTDTSFVTTWKTLKYSLHLVSLAKYKAYDQGKYPASPHL